MYLAKTIEPILNRILVSPIKEESSLEKAGLVVVDDGKKKPVMAKVIAAGPGKRNPTTGKLSPMCVGVGDTIIYSGFKGVPVKFNGQDYLMMNDTDVEGVCE